MVFSWLSYVKLTESYFTCVEAGIRAYYGAMESFQRVVRGNTHDKNSEGCPHFVSLCDI